MTHPFHPLCGEEFRLVEVRWCWGEERVCYEDKSGELTMMPARWTSAAEPDPVVVLGAGQLLFRAEDLLLLARLLRDVEELGVVNDGHEQV